MNLMIKATIFGLGFLAAISANTLPALAVLQGRNEQEALIRRAERLQRQMEKMKVRYQKEGKKEYVVLLDEGLRWISESQLIRKMNETSLAISSKERKAIQAAKKVLGDIDKLLSILLDRRSIEDLEKETKGVEKQLQTLKRLQQKQEKLKRAMKKLRDASQTQEEARITEHLKELAERERDEARKNAARAGFLQRFLEQALDEVQNMQKASQEIQKQIQRPQEESKNSSGLNAIQLFRKTQKEIARLEVARSLEKAIKDLAGQPQKPGSHIPFSLQSANRQMQNLDESFPEGLSKQEKQKWESLLSKAQKEGKPSAQTRKELRQFLESFANQSREMRNELSRRSESLSKKTERKKVKRALKNASDYLRKSAQDVSKKEALLQTGKALQELMDALAASAIRPVKERAEELKQKAETLVDGLEMQKPKKELHLEKAMAALKEASRKADKMAQASPPKNWGTQAKDLSQALDKASLSLKKSLEILKKRVAGKAEEGARDQENLKKQLDKIAKAIQKAKDKGSLSNDQAKAAEKSLQAAKSEMNRAQTNLQNASPSKASRNQNKAAENLEKAARDLGRLRKPGEQAKAEMSRLAKKQEELEQEILQLAQRIDSRKNAKAKQALEEAAQAAKRARKAMKSGQMEQSQQNQDQAAKKLEEARKNLEDERDRYWRLRQEELLFRMGEEVQVLIEKQRELNRKTLDLVGEAANAERLPRRLRTRIRALGRGEKELEARARFLAENLKKEGTLVFTFVLESIADDLAEIGRIFSARRPRVDSFVQGLQVEVLTRLKMLKDSLEEEQKRKKQKNNKKPNQSKPNTNEGDQKPKLVPDVAELRMLKRLELATKRRIDNFLRLQQSLPGGLGELETDALKRLALRHAKVSDLFQTFLKTRGLLNGPNGAHGKKGKDGKRASGKQEKKD